MKFKMEKNLKIVNELITYFNKLGNTNVHIDLSSDNENSYFNIYGEDDSELTLVGMMINKAKVSYENKILKISLIREET